MALLEVNDLRTHFRTDDGVVKAVDGVSFQVEKGKTLGIVGESGSGKSVTCLTIMGLNAKRNTMTSGEALWKDRNLLTMNSRELRAIRGNAVTFQSASRVEGDVFHKSLAIEQGAFFEGKSRRSDDPLAGANRPEIPVSKLPGANGAG